MNLLELQQPIISLARQAGVVIMGVYSRDDQGASSKADDSPLTIADIASHETIVKGLSRLTPDIPILSEEASNIPYARRCNWQRLWLVDPLDGTKEFIKRNGEFTVNIALIESGEPVLGVVYAPALGATYYAARGAGAFAQRAGEITRRISVVAQQADEPVRAVASRSHRDERTTNFLESLGAYECVSMGSSLKLCLVAEGSAHLYPRLGPTMEWDTAAAHVVVKEAGGRVVDRQGQSLHYNKPNLLNPEFLVCGRQDEDLVRKLRIGLV